MANRSSLDDKLAAIRRVRDQGTSAENTAELKRSLRDRSNLVVAASAAVVGEQTLVELAADLEAAFTRFMGNPLKEDKLCRAKIAVIRALDSLEHAGEEIFEKAARHIQFEPVWGGQEDTAAPLRAAALFALARIGNPQHLPLLVDSLVDHGKDVRMAAAQSLVSFENEGAGLLLRLKVRIGDKEPEVLTECFSGLLTINPKDHLALVSSFLASELDARCESAVIALGRSRLPEALDLLRSFWNRSVSSEMKDQILLAIAMLRQPAAIDYLLELVAADSEKHAIDALFALKIHSYDPRLCERIAAIIQKKGDRTLQARFDRDFRTND